MPRKKKQGHHRIQRHFLNHSSVPLNISFIAIINSELLMRIALRYAIFQHVLRWDGFLDEGLEEVFLKKARYKFLKLPQNLHLLRRCNILCLQILSKALFMSKKTASTYFRSLKHVWTACSKYISWSIVEWWFLYPQWWAERCVSLSRSLPTTSHAWGAEVWKCCWRHVFRLKTKGCTL